LIVVAVIGVLAAMTVGVLGRGREMARRAQCDARLKSIAIALDAYAQENGTYPQDLSELVTGHYITDPDMLRCPDDPDSNSDGYAPY